ncbi:MAG: hypothetical protein HY909_02460 [Deltaproteobacteria bacterium]|nr:hypothetical protein [Deltaproteobacteria bacterium]
MRWPGTGELLFILILCFVVYAGSKVNPWGDLLGKFVRNLQRGLKNDDRIVVRPGPEPEKKQESAPRSRES